MVVVGLDLCCCVVGRGGTSAGHRVPWTPPNVTDVGPVSSHSTATMSQGPAKMSQGRTIDVSVGQWPWAKGRGVASYVVARSCCSTACLCSCCQRCESGCCPPRP